MFCHASMSQFWRWILFILFVFILLSMQSNDSFYSGQWLTFLFYLNDSIVFRFRNLYFYFGRVQFFVRSERLSWCGKRERIAPLTFGTLPCFLSLSVCSMSVLIIYCTLLSLTHTFTRSTIDVSYRFGNDIWYWLHLLTFHIHFKFMPYNYFQWSE